MTPTHKMLAEVWRTMRQRLAPVTWRVNEQQHRIELLTEGLIEMWSLQQADNIRGRSYDLVVLDEAAMLPNLGAVWQEVVRPTLADLHGDAWLISTPRGRDFFWECFQRGQQPVSEWMSWQLPTASNPYIDTAEIEAARHELPERVFRQEFLAEFLDAGGGVFRRVREAATATPQMQALPGHSYVMGVDLARQHDYSVLAVLDTTTHELVALDRFNRIDYQTQIGRLYALYERFVPGVLVVEQNSIGVPLIEQMQRAGLPVVPFVTSNASKTRLIDSLALAFEQAALRILDDAVLLAELQAFELERLPSGLVRYSAPPGQHDDCVMALALAWHAAQDDGALVLW